MKLTFFQDWLLGISTEYGVCPRHCHRQRHSYGGWCLGPLQHGWLRRLHILKTRSTIVSVATKEKNEFWTAELNMAHQVVIHSLMLIRTLGGAV